MDTLGLNLTIRLAYVISRGNPLKKYNSFDFDLSSDQFLVESGGLNIDRCSDNIIEFTSTVSNNLFLKVTGFDEARDLYIKIK